MSVLQSSQKDATNSESGALAGVSRRSTLWASCLLTTTCLAWLAASTGIIMANRSLIVTYAFKYPIALSAMGQCVTFLGAWIICDVLKWAGPPPTQISYSFFLTRIVPIGVAQGLGIVFSNQLYMYLTVAFIEMSRSVVPLMTMFALWGVGLEIPSSVQVATVVLSGVGSCISAWGEAALSVPGLAILAISFTIEVLRMVMLQYLMQGQKLDPWQGVKLMSLPACVGLLGLMVVMELQNMIAANAGVLILKHWPAFMLAAFLGLAVNYISTSVINLSSATTMKLLAGVRGPLIVMCAVVFFAEKVGAVQLAGYSLAIVGFFAYQVFRARSMKTSSQSSSNGQALPSGYSKLAITDEEQDRTSNDSDKIGAIWPQGDMDGHAGKDNVLGSKCELGIGRMNSTQSMFRLAQKAGVGKD